MCSSVVNCNGATETLNLVADTIAPINLYRPGWFLSSLPWRKPTVRQFFRLEWGDTLGAWRRAWRVTGKHALHRGFLEALILMRQGVSFDTEGKLTQPASSSSSTHFKS